MSLEKALAALESTYEPGIASKLKDYGTSIDVEFISTGSLVVDGLLGGGFPKGRIVEIYGPESSGKTTLAMHGMAECQKQGGTVALIDMEHAFDKFYAGNLGMDTDEMILSQPMYGEQALDVVEKLIDSQEVDMIVIDSVSALIPKRQLEGDFGDSNIGIQAKMMSQGLPKLLTKASKYKCTLIFINQIRMKVGVMFGSPETTSGGQSLKFYASQRIDIRKKQTIKEGEIAIANQIKVKVIKNKVAPPFCEGFTQIKFGVGIYRAGEILALAVDFDIVKKAGSWYSYNDEKLGQGQIKTLSLIEDNPELMDELELKVKEKMLDLD